VAVLCCREAPSRKEINNFLNYLKQQSHELNEYEIIIITQQDSPRKRYSLKNKTLFIQQYSEIWLLDNLIDFDDYFIKLKKKVEQDSLPNSNLKLLDTYVPSKITDNNKQAIEQNLEEYLTQWITEAGQKQLALLGQYGQGKTTGALMFSYNLILQREKQKEKNLLRIPIFLELRGKSPKTLQPIELLNLWGADYHINAQALMVLLKAGRLLLIFDGFDEMSDIFDHESRYNHFRSLWRFCYPKAKILITGRPNFFAAGETKTLLGLDRSESSQTYVQALHLQPFDLEQMAESLKNAPLQNRNEILELAKNDSKFKDIVARPSLLCIVNELWNKGVLKQYKHDINSALIIKLFTEHNYQRQIDKERESQEFNPPLTPIERSYFTTGIAVYMVKNGLQNQITLDEFKKIIQILYEVIPDTILNKKNALNDDIKEALKIRLRDRKDPLAEIVTDIQSHSLFVTDHSRSDSLKFPHKSFLEYLFAEFIEQRLVNKDNAEMAAIWKATKAEPIDLLETLEALEFTGELLLNNPKIKELKEDKKKLLSYLYNFIDRKSVIPNQFRMVFIMKFYSNKNIKNTKKNENNITYNILLFIIIALLFLSYIIPSIVPFFIGSIMVFLISYLIKININLINIIITFIINFKSKKIKLWFLLSLIFGIKKKNIKSFYGENAHQNLTESIKFSKAEYFLEKYDYSNKKP